MTKADAAIPDTLHSCKRCKRLRGGGEGWERPDIWWWECGKHPEYEQLLSFPFKNTKCPDWIGQPVGS